MSDTGVIERIEPTGEGRRKNRVLIIDEEAPLTDLLTLSLTFEGWEVQTLANGNEAVDVVHRFRPDAILLDMMLPDISGVAVVSRLRDAGVGTPVIFLTGRTSLEDRLAAFGAGGDDYMTKPFGLEEVSTRLRAVFRRAGLTDSSIIFADLVIDGARAGLARRRACPAVIARGAVAQTARRAGGRSDRRNRHHPQPRTRGTHGDRLGRHARRRQPAHQNQRG